MARSYTTLRDLVELILGDSSNATWSTATLDLLIPDQLREIANFVPHVVKETVQVESRSGTATADTASALVDSTNAQFLSTDVGKVVYNSEDKTWAVVMAYVTASQLTLSKDIFPDGNEAYNIFNEGCVNARQVYIGDIPDFIRVRHLEYPIGTERSFSVEGSVVNLDIDFDPDDTSETDTDKDVDIYVSRKHFVSQLTTLTGAVDLLAGYSAGDTSMVLDACQASATIQEGQEFTIAGLGDTYRLKADAVVSGAGAVTITFFPGLEAAVADNKVITFIKSTLDGELERIVCNRVAAQAMLNHCAFLALNQMVTGSEPYRALRQQSLDMMGLSTRDLQRIAQRNQRPGINFPRGS